MAKTGYFKGDRIRYTGKVTKDGFHEFVYLEGTKKGQTGHSWSAAERKAHVAKKQKDWKDEQAGFRRLATKTPKATTRKRSVRKSAK